MNQPPKKSPLTPDVVDELTDEWREINLADDDESKARVKEIQRTIRRAPHTARCRVCWDAEQGGRETMVTITVPRPRAAGVLNPHFRVNDQLFPAGAHTVRLCTAQTLAWLIDQNDRIDRNRMGPGGRGEGKSYEFDLDKGILGERARVIRED